MNAAAATSAFVEPLTVETPLIYSHPISRLHDKEVLAEKGFYHDLSSDNVVLLSFLDGCATTGSPCLFEDGGTSTLRFLQGSWHVCALSGAPEIGGTEDHLLVR